MRFDAAFRTWIPAFAGTTCIGQLDLTASGSGPLFVGRISKEFE